MTSHLLDKFLYELCIVCVCIQSAYGSLNLLTYQHPAQQNQQCYMCPPGYHLKSIGQSYESCMINRCGITTFPDCVPCPSGYYLDEWSLSPRCHEQVRCNGEGEKLLRSGGVKNKNVCGCKDGYRYADDECVKCKCAESTTTESPIIPLPRIGITEKVVPTTTVSAHKPDSTKSTTQKAIEISKEACDCMLSIFIAVLLAIISLTAIVTTVCFWLRRNKKGASSSNEEGNQLMPERNGNNDTVDDWIDESFSQSDPSEKKRLNDLRLAQKAIVTRLLEDRPFFIYGLNLKDVIYLRAKDEYSDQGERITRLLARWRKYQGVAASAEKLIKALRTNDVEEIELAHLIEREIGRKSEMKTQSLENRQCDTVSLSNSSNENSFVYHKIDTLISEIPSCILTMISTTVRSKLQTISAVGEWTNVQSDLVYTL